MKDEAYIGVWESKAGITCLDRTEACENKERIAKRKLRSKYYLTKEHVDVNLKS